MGSQSGNVKTTRVEALVPPDKRGFVLRDVRIASSHEAASGSFGDTLTTLEIEYALDGGRVEMTNAHVRGTITLYDKQFGEIEQFEPYYQKFKSQFGGDYAAWNEDGSAHEFRWAEATLRHEFLHFYSYRTAVTDLWPKYKQAVRKHLGDEGAWELATGQFWKEEWRRYVELQVIMHEEIHIYTLKSMVEEYERFKQTGKRP